MQTVDRKEVLARIDLVDLATQVCGPPRGHGTSARWHCPSPDHPDQHPSMGVFVDRAGQQRWKCHSCGEAGTAVDMLMIGTGTSAGDALRDLARSVGLDAPDHAQLHRAAAPRVAHSRPSRTHHAQATRPDPAVERFVAAAQDMLWQPIGRDARRYLHDRGFSKELLVANRVGYDPGPYVLPRAKGLPRRGDGIVFPALNPTDGQASYFQVRALNPKDAADRKYDQPTTALAPNPRLVPVRSPKPTTSATLAICEGFPDAYTATLAGLPAVALLGVSHAAAAGVDDLANALLHDHPAAAGYAICFDTDRRANQFALALGDRLARTGTTVARLTPTAPHKDLNEWWRAAPAQLTNQLSAPLSGQHLAFQPPAPILTS